MTNRSFFAFIFTLLVATTLYAATEAQHWFIWMLCGALIVFAIWGTLSVDRDL